MLTASPCIPTATWHGCYDGSWRDLIVPTAFAHPAKFAPGLVQRIYAHGISRGWWSVGDLIGDPFGGIAGGGIMAGYAGLNWIGSELESRFVELGNRNLALHAPKWAALAEVSCVKLVQGDSRRFAEIVGAAAGIVTSPPYSDSCMGGSGEGPGMAGNEQQRRRIYSGAATENAGKAAAVGYGASPGQIGALKSGDIAGVVTSPPFRDARSDTTKSSMTKHGGDCADRHHTTQAGAGYGDSAGQIDALPTGTVDGVVTSPPYAKSMDTVENPEAREARTNGFKCGQKNLRYAQNPHTFLSKDPSGLNNEERRAIADSNDQIGQLREETYWQAMSIVYGQCLAALRPGGVLVCVVKDYVQNKKRVPLCDQTLRLLIHVGFEPVERIHAMLVREHVDHCMFSGPRIVRKERKSFFRRLAEKKGSPRIDWEEVLVVRKAGEPC